MEVYGANKAEPLIGRLPLAHGWMMENGKKDFRGTTWAI
jgi:hypothetical protein